MLDTRLSRRRFLLQSAALGAGAAFGLSACTQSQQRSGASLGPSEDIRVAVVGIRGRGAGLANECRANKGVRVVALCDADRTILDKGAKDASKRGQRASTYTDIRRVLDRKDIDAIVTATPNHWHALATVWACQAGKDVYVEKPACWSIWEGRKMIEAAEKYKRMVQVGMQRRSDQTFYEMIEWFKAGNVGKIIYALGLCYKDRDSIGKVTGPTPIPRSIDYNLWCGPSRMGPLMRKNLHYDWHWVWETGNGDIGNQGVHEVDQCRWVLGHKSLPTRVYSFGGRFLWDDDGQTPNTQLACWDYPVPMFHEVRNIRRKAGDTAMDHVKGTRIGIYVHLEGGYYVGGENGGWVHDHKDQRIRQFVQDGSGKHTNNFFAAMRSRNASELHAPVQEGHLSASLCHMANISYRLGERMPPQLLSNSIRGDKLAAASWDRIQQHLAANNVDLNLSLPTLGATLAFDPTTERFTGLPGEKANAMLKREYRAPFVIPEVV